MSHHCIVFIRCFSLYFIQVYGFLPILSVITSPFTHHNQSPNQYVGCCISPDRPFLLRTLFRFLTLSHILFFIASLLFCCA